MIRISFSKIQFSQNTQAEQTFIQIETENSSTLKLKPKKKYSQAIINFVAKNLFKKDYDFYEKMPKIACQKQVQYSYGEFLELETNNNDLKLNIYSSELGKTQNLVERILLKKNTYGLWYKKSHFVQTIKLKLWFDSQIIDYQNSKTQDSTNESSGFTGNGILNQRMGLMKVLREFSPEQKCTLQKSSQVNALTTNQSKNMTMRIFPKSTFKDFMTIGL